MNKLPQNLTEAFKRGSGRFGKGGAGGGAPAFGALGAIIGGGLLLWAGSESLFNVEGGHGAIVFNRFVGVKPTIYPEGTHLLIPWVERAIIYDTRAKPITMPSLTGSKDLQMVNVTIRVLFKPDTSALPTLYRTLGTDFEERVFPSIINEVLKAVVAQFNAAQLITQRQEVSNMIRKQLVRRAHDFHILLDDVSITHLGFGKEYTAAIEAKQVAQQDTERARFLVEKAQQDKRSIIVKAEGEAQSAKMISEAIHENPAFIQLRRLEAARDIATLVSKGGNRVYLPAENLLLDVFGEKSTN